jgi:hypothetical protein
MRVVVNGSYAYLLQTMPGNPAYTDFIVVNLSNPSIPNIVARMTTGTGSDLQVAGGYAYVAVTANTILGTTNSLRIINVNTPNAPVLVGSVNLASAPSSVVVTGSYAFVATGASVQVINVSNPSTPFIVTSLAPSGFSCTAMAISTNRLYTVNNSSQFNIIDITDPTAPALLKSTLLTNSNGLSSQAVTVTNNLAFLARPALDHTDTGGGVFVYDVSNPLNPILLKQIIVPGTARTITSNNNTVFSGDTAAVIDIISF